MSLRVNTNIEAMIAMRNLGITGNNFAKSVEKLSSGMRINRAGDDAAGLSISEKLRAQVRGTQQAARNAQDAISMIQTAEGALSEVHDMLQRMRELSVQGSNGTLTDADRSAINAEIQALGQELDAVSTRTKFNGLYLLAGALDNSATSVSVAASSSLSVGDFDTNVLVRTIAFSNSTEANQYYFSFSSANSTITLTRTSDGSSATATATSLVSGATAIYTFDFSSGTDVAITVEGVDSAGATTAEIGQFFTASATNSLKSDLTNGNKTASYHIGPDANQTFTVDFDSATQSSVGIATALTNLNTGTSSVSEFEALITALDGSSTGVAYVSNLRSNLGAVQNRLEHAIRNLDVSAENMTSAESRIRDADIAVESVAFSRTQILQQAGTAVLAQANVAPQAVLALLRG
jgi:flagellin